MELTRNEKKRLLCLSKPLRTLTTRCGRTLAVRAKCVAALQLVAYLIEDFADLVLDGVGTFCLLLESSQIRKELQVDVFFQVVASECLIVVERAVNSFRCCP